MLSVSKYERDHIDAAKAKVREDVAAFEAVAKAAGKGGAGAVATLEPVFFNNMVLALEALFMHRGRGQEGKDGNPLNEVRVLSVSLLQNGGRMGADKTIKLKPTESVLGYEVGDEIKVSAADFDRLSTAYFDEIEARFT